MFLPVPYLKTSATHSLHRAHNVHLLLLQSLNFLLFCKDAMLLHNGVFIQMVLAV